MLSHDYPIFIKPTLTHTPTLIDAIARVTTITSSDALIITEKVDACIHSALYIFQTF
jgi:hypothetical protein